MARYGMPYRITIEREDADSEMTIPKVTQIYHQAFDELDVHELITRINHKPRTRNRATKKKEAAK